MPFKENFDSVGTKIKSIVYEIKNSYTINADPVDTSDSFMLYLIPAFAMTIIIAAIYFKLYSWNPPEIKQTVNGNTVSDDAAASEKEIKKEEDIVSADAQVGAGNPYSGNQPQQKDKNKIMAFLSLFFNNFYSVVTNLKSKEYLISTFAVTIAIVAICFNQYITNSLFRSPPSLQSDS